MGDGEMGRDTCRLRAQVAKLWLFNPGHEEALARADSPNYTPRREIIQMMNDLSPLVSLLANSGDYYWSFRLGKPIPFGLQSEWNNDLNAYPVTMEVALWAREPHILRQIESRCSLLGIKLLLPTIPDEYYRLAHRRSAWGLLHHLIGALGYPDYLLPHWLNYTHPTQLSQDITQAIEALEATKFPIRGLFLKRPYSSSGRGVMPLPYPLTSAQSFVVERSCRKAGAVSIEIELEVVEDWALEYLVSWDGTDRRTTFVAFSHFSTGAGGKSYSGNILRPQAVLRRQLASIVGEEALEQLIHEIGRYLEEHISPYYEGYIGIDLFTYKNEGRILLHPAVEINLRTTMGVIATLAYDRYCSQQVEARYSLVYDRAVMELYEEHLRNSPAVFDKQGKLTGGVLPLTTPMDTSQFYAYIEIV